MLQSTQDLMKAVEERTGRFVLVDVQPLSGTLLSSSQIARGTDPAHLIRISPKAEQDQDYLVTWECLHILRLLDVPPGQRYQLRATANGQRQALELAAKHVKKHALSIAEESIPAFSRQMYDGLGLQLRSVPTGLRIDAEIAASYPDLHPKQRNSAFRQLDDNAKVLAPSVTELIPPKIRRASVNMSAAFALFWARTWDDPTIVVPYRAAGFLADGERLLSIFDQVSNEPSHDKELIEAWRKYLQIDSWYELSDLT